MENEVKKHPAQKIAKAILANQVALNANHDLLTSAPQMYRHNLKMAYKNYIHQLGKSESEYDLLFNQVEDNVCDTYDAVDLFFYNCCQN